jgi:hypothetical protein
MLLSTWVRQEFINRQPVLLLTQCLGKCTPSATGKKYGVYSLLGWFVYKVIKLEYGAFL